MNLSGKTGSNLSNTYSLKQILYSECILGGVNYIKFHHETKGLPVYELMRLEDLLYKYPHSDWEWVMKGYIH